MSRTLTIRTSNGNIDYVVPELDFTNVACDLEDFGVDILSDSAESQPMSLCRAMIAIVTGEKNKVKAGMMLTDHMRNGGKIEEIMDIFKEAMQISGFGKANVETAATEEPKEEMPEKKEKSSK